MKKEYSVKELKNINYKLDKNEYYIKQIEKDTDKIKMVYYLGNIESIKENNNKNTTVILKSILLIAIMILIYIAMIIDTNKKINELYEQYYITEECNYKNHNN